MNVNGMQRNINWNCRGSANKKERKKRLSACTNSSRRECRRDMGAKKKNVQEMKSVERRELGTREGAEKGQSEEERAYC